MVPPVDVNGLQGVMRTEHGVRQAWETGVRSLGIGAAVLLVLVVAFTAWVFRDTLNAYAITPGIGFQAAPRPPTPDYGITRAWAALPGRLDGSDLAPGNAAGGLAEVWRRVDVFFVHATTFASSEGWNGPMDGAAGLMVDTQALPQAASAFAAAGRVYAPRYRQATLHAFRSGSEDARRAQSFAYQDVRRAFRHYMRFRNRGRPFILVGHGQGALHTLGLLQDDILGSTIQERLIAAYLVGHPVPLDLFTGPLRGMAPCRDPNDTGCLAAWTLAGETPDYALVWQNQRLAPVGERAVLCTNPLTWFTDEGAASRMTNAGALKTSAALHPAPLVLGVTGAVCEGGVLKTDTDLPAALSGSARDVTLFYQSIRENTAARATAFFSRR